MVKERLMKALKSAVEDYNQGMDVDLAVVKAAEASDFNEMQTERLVEMMNTALALGQEKSASDPAEPCVLSSKDKVLGMLVKRCGNEKAASARIVSNDYSFYSEDPVRTNPSIEARMSGVSLMVKAADESSPRVEPGLDLSKDSIFKHIISGIELLKSASESADDVVRGMESEIESGCKEIAKSIEASGSDCADMFKAACEQKNVVDMVSEYSSLVAESDGGAYSRCNVFDASKIDGILKRAEEIGKYVSEKKAYEAKRDMYSSKAAEAEDELMGVVGLQKSAAEADCVRLSDMLNPSFRKLASDEKTAQSMAKNMVMPRMTLPVPSMGSAFSSIAKGEGVPGEKKILDNVDRSMLLSDLMTNDPIIRDAPPEDVVEIYKSIVMTSPRVSLDKALVRSILRSAVNSIALSPNDAKVMSDVDKGIALSNLERLTNLDSSIKDSNRI